MLIIDDKAYVSPLADIEDSVRGSRIRIEAYASIDSFVKVKPAGGSGDFVLGCYSQINSGCVLYTGNGISIGQYVAVAANCTFAPTNHRFDDLDNPIMKQGFMASRGGIIVEDDVWIGANVVLLDGAIVRKGAIIGAGSVVIGEMLGNSVYCGAPARLMRARKEPQRPHRPLDI